MLNFACISPHPPMVIPTIGEERQRKKVKKSTKSLERLGEGLQKKDPDTLLVISPHLPLSRSHFSIFSNKKLKGDLKQFGDFQTKLSFPGNPELAGKINTKLKENKIPSREVKLQKLDHGSLVPLHFLTQKIKEKDLKIIPLAFCDIDLKTHLQAGKIIGKILQESELKIGICASGDLSHRLKEGAPAGYHPKGEKFDQKLIQLIREKKTKEITNLDQKLIEKAGECGLRSIIMLLGALKARGSWEPEVLSYQGPFGVGYLTAGFQLN